MKKKCPCGGELKEKRRYFIKGKEVCGKCYEKEIKK